MYFASWVISISFYLFPGPFCKNAIETCQCKSNLQEVILCISFLPDIQVIKRFALIERCHCRPHEWSKSYQDEFHLNYFYRDCDFLFFIFRVRRRWLLQRQIRSCHRNIRRKGFHLRWRVQFSHKSHCKVRRHCNEKGLQYVCNSEWWLVCSKFYYATNLWQKWKITNCMADGEGGPWANNVYILSGTFLRKIIRLQ